MTTFDSALAAGGSATRHRLSADQRRRLADVPSALPLWLSPLQTMRTAAQEIAHELGVPVAFAGFRGGAWQVLGESREDSSTLSARIAHGPTFAQAADALSEAPAARWELEGREHTLVPLPVGPAPRGVLLVLEGDWTLSASELQDCAAALVDVPVRPAVPPGASAESLARQLAKAVDAAEACEALVRFAVAAVPSRYASVALPAPDDTLAIVAAHGYAAALTSHVRIEPGRGLIGAVYRRGRPLLVRDVDAFRGAAQRRARFRTKSCVVVPVTAGADVLGVLCLADREGDVPFVADDVAKLGALVAPAALALARLRSERHVESLAQAAIVDPASGLFNRFYFQSRLQEELQRATRQGTALSLQLIDVDSFKTVNDRFGHLAGDAIIKDVADILRRSVRVFDVCARYGGDEFAVVMPGSRLQSAAAVAERIRLRIADRQPPRSHEPDVTVSIGVAELQSGDHARDVIDRADRAMYEAKRAGKNRVVATPPPSPSTP
jgi:diguanylate cyclase (GGDEF)-like protein